MKDTAQELQNTEQSYFRGAGAQPGAEPNPRGRSRRSGPPGAPGSPPPPRARVVLPCPLPRPPRCLLGDFSVVLPRSFCLAAVPGLRSPRTLWGSHTPAQPRAPRRCSGHPDPGFPRRGHCGEAPPTGSPSSPPPPTGSLWRSCTGVLSVPISCD